MNSRFKITDYQVLNLLTILIAVHQKEKVNSIEGAEQATDQYQSNRANNEAFELLLQYEEACKGCEGE